MRVDARAGEPGGDEAHSGAAAARPGAAAMVWRMLSAPFSQRGLSGIALAGFFLLSVAATGLGFADLRAANTEAERLAPVEIGLIAATTVFVVSAMIVALHNAFFPPRWWVGPISFLVYLFFAAWSVGFGYGFFWKELAGQEHTERQFEQMIGEAAAALTRTSEALSAAQDAAVGAARLARERAEAEASTGRTCANRPFSTPGEGPLMRGRFAFADRVEDLAGEVGARWIDPLGSDRVRLERRVAALTTRRAPAEPSLPPDERQLLERLAGASALARGERRALFAGVHRDARAFADRANALKEGNARPAADRLRALAAEVGPDPAIPGSPDPAREGDDGYCWDVVLNDRLLAAAARIDAILPVETPEFEFTEGPKATREAFFALVRTVTGWMGASAAGGREGGDAGAAPEFGEKEALALFASIAVDLGIVFLTLVRAAPPVRRPAGPPPQGPTPPPAPPRLHSVAAGLGRREAEGRAPAGRRFERRRGR